MGVGADRDRVGIGTRPDGLGEGQGAVRMYPVGPGETSVTGRRDDFQNVFGKTQHGRGRGGGALAGQWCRSRWRISLWIQYRSRWRISLWIQYLRPSVDSRPSLRFTPCWDGGRASGRQASFRRPMDSAARPCRSSAAERPRYAQPARRGDAQRAAAPSVTLARAAPQRSRSRPTARLTGPHPNDAHSP